MREQHEAEMTQLESLVSSSRGLLRKQNKRFLEQVEHDDYQDGIYDVEEDDDHYDDDHVEGGQAGVGRLCDRAAVGGQRQAHRRAREAQGELQSHRHLNNRWTGTKRLLGFWQLTLGSGKAQEKTPSHINLILNLASEKYRIVDVYSLFLPFE